MDVSFLVESAAERGASDIHIVRGIPAKARISGSLENLTNEPLTDADCENIARQLAGSGFSEIEKIGELDMAKTIAGERIRINLFRQQGSVSAALRILSNEIPELDDLGLPQIVKEFPKYRKGIVLVTGETGSGKSTTLAALINQINRTRSEHIITLEDPIEYIYTPDRCIINQREIGKDTESYANGLRAILREDPDIILIGEMRDLDTIETAITAAETGHLVFATLHTNSAVETISRIVNVFPAERQEEIRMELSGALQAVLSQQLLVKASGRGRVLACEVMIVTPALQNQIREGKAHQMQSSLLASAMEGSMTMDNCLVDLARKGKITPQTALEAGNDKEYLRKHIRRY
ncbi:MAG: type IV pilus twitching motility protein PilT [Eubacterium sp.]|nr:type IV pilus twitching motility protein PilT [Eubacterium sp.]